MFRFVLALVIAGIGVYLLASGAMGTLTPPEGMPSPKDVAIYAALPLILMVFAVTMSESGMARLFFALVLIGAIAVLGYLGLALFA